MKWLEQRTCKTRSRGGKEVKGSKGFFLCFFCFLCFLSPIRAEEQKPPSFASKVLTEVEALKGENLQLRYDSIDKQMRLMQAQFQQLQAQQGEIIGQLQALEKEILQAHGLSATPPGEWNVNWAEKTVQEISRSNTANAEKALEKKQ
ncbi:MAG: hypothetical protein O7A06_13095 [Acidobacteria bacterium]|nr:hypothetical protein [Acidobacteriota bacterium]MCZ6491452.1 hypothetical protein [Acidobacteriota bacterium]MCZ6751320.1 hypothetical protein [Acidobacteriota bacterium]